MSQFVTQDADAVRLAVIHNGIPVFHHHLTIFPFIYGREFIADEVTVESHAIDARKLRFVMRPDVVFASPRLGVVLPFSRENEDHKGDRPSIHEALEIHPLGLSQAQRFIIKLIDVRILTVALVGSIIGTRTRKLHLSQHFKLGRELTVALIYEVIAHTPA